MSVNSSGRSVVMLSMPQPSNVCTPIDVVDVVRSEDQSSGTDKKLNGVHGLPHGQELLKSQRLPFYHSGAFLSMIRELKSKGRKGLRITEFRKMADTLTPK